MTNSRFRPLLNNLLVDLVDCWQRKTPELLRVESAFMLTMKHWREVKTECWHNPFMTIEEEIDFFKNIKSHFTGRLAYYTILYEALISMPNKLDEVIQYWRNELERYDRFIEKNKAFIHYLESGCQDHDREYFLRKNFAQPVSLYVKVYDGDEDFCTTKDPLVSACFAEHAYKQYVLGRLHS